MLAWQHGAELRLHAGLLVALAPGGALRQTHVFLLPPTRCPCRQALARIEPPVKHLHHRAADATAGPHELERGEQSPRIVTLDNGLGENVPRHGRGVDAVAAEAAGEPKASRKLSDLRHPMQRIAEHARPGMLNLDIGELRINRCHIGFEPAHEPLGIGLPRRRMSGPEQPVVADDAVMITREVGIGHRAAIGDGSGKPRPERRGGHRIAPDRQQRAGDARHQRAEMDAAGEHDMGGAHARGWRGDPLAHAFGVDRERGRVLENARAGRFRQFGQAQGVVERMDVECARQMHGMEVVIGLENVPHPLRRPYLDFSAELLGIELRII